MMKVCISNTLLNVAFRVILNLYNHVMTSGVCLPVISLI